MTPPKNDTTLAETPVDGEQTAAANGDKPKAEKKPGSYTVLRAVSEDEASSDASGLIAAAQKGNLFVRLASGVTATNDKKAIDQTVSDDDLDGETVFVGLSRFNERKPKVETKTRRAW